MSWMGKSICNIRWTPGIVAGHTARVLFALSSVVLMRASKEAARARHAGQKLALPGSPTQILPQSRGRLPFVPTVASFCPVWPVPPLPVLMGLGGRSAAPTTRSPRLAGEDLAKGRKAPSRASSPAGNVLVIIDDRVPLRVRMGFIVGAGFDACVRAKKLPATHSP